MVADVLLENMSMFYSLLEISVFKRIKNSYYFSKNEEFNVDA